MPIYGYQGRLGVQDDQMVQYLNQARGQNPIGRLGQISNFAALEQAGQARTAQQRAQVEAAARALDKQVQQESAAAEQRGQVARSQQLQEQQQRLEQERFNQQLALQRTQLEEQKAYRDQQERIRKLETAPYKVWWDAKSYDPGPNYGGNLKTYMDQGYSRAAATRLVDQFYTAGGGGSNAYPYASWNG